MTLLGLVFVGVAAAQTVFTPAWSSYVGGDFDTDGVRAVAPDAAANTYLGGFLGQGWIQNLNGVTDPPFFSGRDGFVAKVAPGGALAWYVCLGDYENDAVQGVAAGTNGALYAVGVSERSDLDDGGTDAFLASLSSATGSNLWSHTIGSLNGTNGFTAVATDANGFIYAVGYTTLAGQLCNVPGYQVGGTNYGTEWKGGTDALVVKWAPNGTVLWRHYLGGLNADAATACAIAPDGSVYVGGETRSPGWATLPSGTPSPVSPDGFLVKLTASGTHVWSAFLGGSAADALSALSVNPLTGALFAGGTTSSSDFLAAAPRLNALAGATDGFVIKLTDTNTAFRTEWCRFLGGSAADSVTALAAQPNGNVSAGGTTSTNGWLAQTGGTAFGGVTDGFVCSLFGDGSPEASAYVGGERRDELYALAVVSNALFAAGCTLSTNWVSGGFWTTWNKYEDFGAGDFGFAAKWTAPQASQPSITAEPSDLTVQEEQPATFSVTAAGTAPLFYQWRRNGALLAGATSNAYALAGASLSNSNDRFTCLVSNLFGSATSREAVLTVTPKPKGTLTVALGPAEAAALGAAWSVDGGATWLAGGALTNLAEGLYAITFRQVAGYTPPDTLTDVPVVSGQTTSRSAAYTVIVPPKGTLTVALGPAEAAALGAAWSVDGGATWLAGGALTNLAAGFYAVTFRPVAGYTPPDPLADVPVVSGQTTSRSAAYTLIPEPVFATRAIAGRTVAVTVRPPAGTSFWQVTEQLPQGLTPSIYTGCAWDPETRTLTYVASGTNQATFSYSVSATNGLFAIGGVLDYVKANQVYSSPVSGDTFVILANVWRHIAGTSVTVTVVPPATNVFVWSVEESLPAGLTPLNVAGPGAAWNAEVRKLTWVLLGDTGATLTYDVAGTPGAYSLAGRATFGGPYEPVFGDSVLTVPGSPPVVPAPTLLSLTPDPGAGRCLLTFVSVANQAYAVQTNAALNASAWADCVEVTGAAEATVSELPMAGPCLFYRVRVLE